MGVRSSSDNQSLRRGLEILEAFNSRKRSWGIRELSREFDINAATVYRLVSTLTKRGYLQKSADTQRYHLGPKVIQLAASYSSEKTLIEVSLRLFKEYEKVFPYLFFLGVMTAARDIVCIAVYESQGPLKITSEAGESVSMYSSALGKLLLAHESDDFIKELVAEKPIEKLTSKTVTSQSGLMKQIREIRKVGYAVNFGEIYEELASVATPVRGFDGNVIAGLSLTYPLAYLETNRLNLPEIIDLAKNIAAEISATIARTVIR